MTKNVFRWLKPAASDFFLSTALFKQLIYEPLRHIFNNWQAVARQMERKSQ